MDCKFFVVNFLRNYKKPPKIYLLHFLSSKPQTFRIHSFYSFKDFEWCDLNNIKKKKYRWFFFFFFFQKNKILHSILLKFNNCLSVKTRRRLVKKWRRRIFNKIVFFCVFSCFWFVFSIRNLLRSPTLIAYI